MSRILKGMLLAAAVLTIPNEGMAHGHSYGYGYHQGGSDHSHGYQHDDHCGHTVVYRPGLLSRLFGGHHVHYSNCGCDGYYGRGGYDGYYGHGTHANYRSGYPSWWYRRDVAHYDNCAY